MLWSARFVIEAFGEQCATQADANAAPKIGGIRIAQLFLHVCENQAQRGRTACYGPAATLRTRRLLLQRPARIRLRVGPGNDGRAEHQPQSLCQVSPRNKYVPGLSDIDVRN